ncbi:MAG: hypothetical protein Rhirs2KO_34380 [Rhizobiaceae bacterium]
MKLTVIDSLTLPGSPQRPNEDASGWTADAAFVIDGATGLGPGILVGNDNSDAAWLAAFAALNMTAMLERGHATDEIVRGINTLVGRIVGAMTSEPPHGWQLPVAGFQMLRAEDGRLVTSGLGDCTLFVADTEGNATTTSPHPSRGAENALAAAMIERAGGLSKLAVADRDAATVEALRASRARFNTPGGPLWTLGAAPDAADHIASATLTPALPATALLASDGFAALVDTYRRYDAAGLVAAARDRGLDELGSELRRIEHEQDPEGQAFPRMKISDDATALLISIQQS